MATIPRYTSREQLTKEAPTGYMKPEQYDFGINPETAAKMSAGAAMQDVADIILEVEQKIKKIQNANAESKANILVAADFAAYTDDFNKNTDLDHAMDDIDSKIAQTREKAMKMFVDPAAREVYSRQFELETLGFKQKLKTELARRQVDLGRVNTLREIDLETSDYINAVTPEEKINSRVQMEAIMDKAISNQLFTNEQGRKELNKIINSADDTAKDVRALNKRREKELAFLQKQAMNAREDELVKMRINRQAPLEELIKMANRDMNEGRIDVKFAEAYINACKSPKTINAKTVDLDFANIISDINKGVKTSTKIRENMLNDVSDGYISEQDFSSASAYLEMLENKNPDDLVAMNVRKSWRGVEVWSENTTKKEESRARMSRSFIKKLQSGVDANIASVEAMREEVLHLHPEVMNYPDGMEYIDDSGRIKRILPNGDVVDIESKTKDIRVKEKK